MPSILFAQGNIDVQETWLMCPDLAEKNCTDAAGIFGYSNWDICNDASTIACTAEVWAVDASGKKIAGELVKKVPSDGRYAVKENPSINLPQSNGVGAVWRLPGVLNGAGKDTYFVSVQSVMNMRKNPGTPVANLKLDMGDMIAGILPVEEIPGTFQPATATDAKNSGRAWGSNGTQYAPDGSACAGTELTACQAIREFPAGYRFGMTLRMGKKPEGWYHGRLYLPTITTTDWKTGAEISITSPNGEKKVATTTVNEKSGWLYLSAKGFSFSSPVINVTLTQDAVVAVPTPTPSPTAVVTVAKVATKKAITITCTKGKVSKKVTGASPKCPSGYKKK